MLAIRVSPTLGPGSLPWDSKPSPSLAAARFRGPIEVSQITPPHTNSYTLTCVKQGLSLEVDSSWSTVQREGGPGGDRHRALL